MSTNPVRHSSPIDSVRGTVITPGDPGYDDARRVWNGMVDRRPAIIVKCADVDDVPPAIAYAREHRLDISLRGGGHHIAGNAVCDGGLVVDLSGLRGVAVDVNRRIASVQPGATLADVDAATQAHGLATPLGINSTTGVAGLTLGGGFGWLTRKHGMTVDNLLSADVVTADGARVVASERENPDLFWAIRGGGGNFGVVTRFDFALHPVGPEIVAGLVVFPHEQAGDVLARYQEFLGDGRSEDVNVWAVLRKAPPLAFLPPAVHGQDVLVLAAFYAGDPRQAEAELAPLRRLGSPLAEHVGVQPYTAWQQAFDPLLTAGARNYWKSHNFSELSRGAIECVTEFAGRLPSPQCEIFLGFVAGAPNRVPADATAYGHRQTRFVMNVHCRWEDRADDGRCIAWARQFFSSAAPYASAGAYINFMTEEEGGRVTAAYGDNYERLVQIKRRYDPDNVFHVNQNIRP